jgi:hypothetical protein
MKPSLLSFLLLVVIFSCDQETAEPTGISAKFNGQEWNADKTTVTESSDGLLISRLVAIGDDDRQLVFSFDLLNLTSTNKTATFRSRDVTLNYLTYDLVSDGLIRLRWQTATEHNLNYFQIQSSNNNTDFFYLDGVTAAGESNTPQDYDRLISLNLDEGQPFYMRLAFVDYNWNVTYSASIPVKTSFPVSVIDTQGSRQICYDGKIEITKYDLKEKTVSGTFSFKYNKSSTAEEVTVTEGKIQNVHY